MSIRAVVTDLDGTLWNGPCITHPAVVEAVAEVGRRGVPLAVATGRRYESARRGLDPLGLHGPTVLLSGAIGVHIDARGGGTGDREWHRAAIPSDAALATYDALLAHGLRPVVHVSDADLDAVIPPDVTTHDDHLAQFAAPKVIDPSQVLASGRVVGMGICGLPESRVADMEAAAAAIDDLAQVYVGADHVMGGWTLLVGPPGVSKITGLRGWVDELGLAPEEILAVGDGTNDVELLAWAGTAVAVEGSEAAAGPHDHLIGRPEDGGWAEILDLL